MMRKYEITITFNDEAKLKQIDLFTALSESAAREKAAQAYGRHGIKSMYVEPYRN